MRYMAVILLALIVLCNNAYAQSELVVELSDKQIDISTDFDGARLSVFGVKPDEGDIAIVVSGPEKRMVVRRKDQTMGMWTNSESVTFRDVPTYYDFATSLPERELAQRLILDENGVGVNALNFSNVGNQNAATLRAFREALIRNQQVKGFFAVEPESVAFISDRFFRADFYLPPNLPSGFYKVSTHYIDSGAIISTTQNEFRVGQIGFSAEVYKFARDNSILYGLSTVLFALIAGVSGYFLLRRD